MDVNAPNSPPNPPINLILSKDADGNSVLQWSAPSVPDPDGDPIESYIIYRDGTAIADRYDEVAGTQTTAIDYDSNGVAHDYWVTAVDSRFAESTPAGTGERMSRLRNEDGFTLAELLVGALLMIIVMSASLERARQPQANGHAHGQARRAAGQGTPGEPGARALAAQRGALARVPDRHRARQRVRPGLPRGRPPERGPGRQRPQPEARALLPRRERSGPRPAARADAALEHADRPCHAVRDGVSGGGLGLVAARRGLPHEPVRRHRSRALVVQPDGQRGR